MLFRVFQFVKLKLSTSQPWVVCVLMIALLWPWLNALMWSYVAPLAIEWVNPSLGWRHTWDALGIVGLSLWIVPLLVSGWGVMKLRQKGIVYPVAIYAVAWAEAAVFAGWILLLLLYWLKSPALPI